MSPVKRSTEWFFAAGMTAWLVLLVAACGNGPERSAAAFCNTLKSEKQAYLKKYDAIDSATAQDTNSLDQALLAAGTPIAAMGDIQVMFDKLSKVAPEEIQSDVEHVRDQMQQELSSASTDPLHAMFSAIVAGFAGSGSWQRVDQYVREHCD